MNRLFLVEAGSVSLNLADERTDRLVNFFSSAAPLIEAVYSSPFLQAARVAHVIGLAMGHQVEIDDERLTGDRFREPVNRWSVEREAAVWVEKVTAEHDEGVVAVVGEGVIRALAAASLHEQLGELNTTRHWVGDRQRQEESPLIIADLITGDVFQMPLNLGVELGAE